MARRIAWWAWWLGLAVRAVQLWLVTHPAPDRVVMAYGIGPTTFAAAIVFGTSAAAVGLVMAMRVPGNRFGWIWVATGVAQAVLAMLLLLAADRAASGAPTWLLAGLVASIGVQTAPFLSSGLALLLFPDGRFASHRWRWLAGALAGVAIVRALEVAAGTATIFLLPTVANPWASGPLADVLRRFDAGEVGLVLLPLVVAGCATSVVVRHRRADVAGRRQIRWFLLGAGVLVFTLLPFAYASIVVGTLEAEAAPTFAFAFLGYSVLPITTLVAITRYRLYEIDRIVNRAVLYGALTAILAGVFTAAVALAQRLFVAMTGERSDAAIVLTTLIVATAYAPLRRRLEAIVDRRFKYEGARFGPIRDEIQRVLAVIDPTAAGARLCRDVVEELEAIGAAIVREDEEPLVSSGVWPVPAALRLPMSAGMGATPLALLVGPRRDGRPHDPAAVEEVRALAALAATALVLPVSG